MSSAAVSTVTVLAPFDGQSEAQIAQLHVLAVVGGQPIATEVLSSQIFALAPVSGVGTESLSNTSQIFGLLVYGTGAVDRFVQRAWTFDLDGHSFYVLQLGKQGTFILDKTTGVWCQWETEGFETWNMENGWTWDGDRIIAGDNSSPIVWEYNPNSTLDDDFRPMRRKVTGVIPLRGRDTLTILGMHLSASLGDSAAGAEIRMRFSDNQGKDWSMWYGISLEPNNFNQVLNFRSLGTARAPGRVFEVEDFGGPVRIDTAELDIYTDEDDE